MFVVLLFIAKLVVKSSPDEVTSKDLVLGSPKFESIKFDNNVITAFTTKSKLKSLQKCDHVKWL